MLTVIAVVVIGVVIGIVKMMVAVFPNINRNGSDAIGVVIEIE